MTFSEMIAECRTRAPQGEAWSIQPHFWHHVYHDGATSDEMTWTIFRHAHGDGSGPCEMYQSKTMEGALALAFPDTTLTAEQQAALVDVADADIAAQADADEDSRQLHTEAASGPWPR